MLDRGDSQAYGSSPYRGELLSYETILTIRQVSCYPRLIIRSMQSLALFIVSWSSTISSPLIPFMQLYKSVKVVIFMLWHTKSFDRG